MTRRIVVIEDHTASRELMVRLLSAGEYQPLPAADGEQGLALAQRERPDLVLCDIELPGMDGFEVLRRLKAEPATSAIPVIAVTAFSMLGSRERALAAGFDGFIAKPVTARTLAGQIGSVIKRDLDQTEGGGV